MAPVYLGPPGMLSPPSSWNNTTVHFHGNLLPSAPKTSLTSFAAIPKVLGQDGIPFGVIYTPDVSGYGLNTPLAVGKQALGKLSSADDVLRSFDAAERMADHLAPRHWPSKDSTPSADSKKLQSHLQSWWENYSDEKLTALGDKAAGQPMGSRARLALTLGTGYQEAVTAKLSSDGLTGDKVSEWASLKEETWKSFNAACESEAPTEADINPFDDDPFDDDVAEVV